MRNMYNIYLVTVLAVMVAGCAPLNRGMDGNTYISTARPAISITVPSLPLRTAGQFTASVTTAEALGGVPVESWIAVFGGGTPQDPMAIVALGTVPPDMYWDYDMIRSFSVDHGVAVFNGQAYQACTFVEGGPKDAFIQFVKTENPGAMQWIVRRFARRDDFNSAKITMEYREQLPVELGTLTNVLPGGISFLREFAERAEKVFIVTALNNTDVQVRMGYPEGIQLRYLNTNFFGTISRYQIID